MPKAKSSLQEISNIFALLVKDSNLRQLGGWTLCLTVFAILWLANWQLFLATAVGIGLMSGCYLLQNSHWQRYCRQWQRFLSGSNRQLLMSVGTGATGAFCTYLAASLWTDAENQWLVVGAMLQGIASLTTLALLMWSLWGRNAHRPETKFEQLLADLSHSSNLKRLVAIRQLTSLVKDNRSVSEYHRQVIEYFRLMLSEPQVLIVKNALLDSLNSLGGVKAPRPEISGRSPVKIPLKLNKLKLKSPNPQGHLL